MTLPESQAIRNLQSDFRTDDTCYYWIEASPLIAEGGIMSVNFFLMKNVDIFISIKDNIDAPDVTCNVLQGDTLIFKL